MAVLLQSPQAGISEAMVLLAVPEVPLDRLFPQRIDLLPFFGVSSFFAFVQILLPYVDTDRFLAVL